MSGVKALGSTQELRLGRQGLSSGEESGIPSVEVKFVDIGKNTGAKAALWTDTDAEARKRGDKQD